MTDYTYIAVSKKGTKIEGKRKAPNKSDLLDYLSNQGLTVITIREDHSNDFKNIFQREIGGFSLAEKVLVAKQLSTMISAGIPVIQAIGILADQTEKVSLKAKFQEVYRKIEAGFTLSKAFSEVGDIFSEVQLNLISAGEKSGNLNEMLSKVAEDLENSKNLKGKILGALIYPAIIFVVMIIVLFVMIVFMIPQITELYESLGQDELPFITQMLVELSSFITSPIFFVSTVLVIGSAWQGYRTYVQDKKRKIVIDKLKLRIPVFGNLMKKIQLTEFCRLSSMLTKSGVPIIDTIEIVARAMSNTVYEKILIDARDELSKGSSLSLSIAKNNINEAIPIILIRIISTGEESGKLDKVLEDMYKYYEEEVNQITGNLTKLLEPFILVLVGGLVAFLAVAIYYPIYQVGNAPALS